ncbi:hypothetical protein HmCmsJML039_04449 [Escherichia coli]|nr:hypothetical protein HmCmsJML039_04449 [Escherichia coli]
MLVVAALSLVCQLAIAAVFRREGMAVNLFVPRPATFVIRQKILHVVERCGVGIRQDNEIKRAVAQRGERIRKVRRTLPATHRRDGQRQAVRGGLAAG